MDTIKRQTKRAIMCSLIYCGVFLLIVFSKEVASGVSIGIKTCVELLIPSLFIFMVTANIIISSKARDVISLPFKPLKRLLRLSASQLSIVILSLVGGYPVGAKLIATSVKRGEMTTRTAQNMLCYCVNCGPAFLISGVGIMVYGNALVGVLMYLSQVASCLIVGVLVRRHIEAPIAPCCSERAQTVPTIVVSAVSDAVVAMGKVCGLVVVFAGIMPLLAILPPTTALIANGIFEVTTACRNLSGQSILLGCIFTAFGGICVHMQVAAMLYGTGVNMKRFIAYRTLYTAMSGAIMWGLMQLNPVATNCISISKVPVAANVVSPTVTICLILMSIMLLFFTKKSVKIK